MNFRLNKKLIKERALTNKLSKQLKCFNRLVLWGYKSPRHSHYYIHQGYYSFFKQNIDIDIVWLENEEASNDLIEPNDLIMIPDTHLISNYESLKIDKPRLDCFYIYHNSIKLPEHWLDKNIKYIKLYEYRNGYKKDLIQKGVSFKEIRPFVLTSSSDRSILQPWGFPILPSKMLSPVTAKTNQVNFAGTIWGDKEGKLNGNYFKIKKLNELLDSKGLEFNVRTKMTEEEEISFLRKSIVSTSIGAIGHDASDYLQCRIFKSITYGVLTLTDTKAFKHILKDSFVNFKSWDEGIDLVTNLNEKEKRKIIKAQQKSIFDYSYLNHWINMLDLFKEIYPEQFR
ncbi:hypothetical protein [Brumimicrobium aurantiacum]|uniref:Glycosyltransferase family 1 protein n=1 Tax=Brumimicrobium aurantiacum TaxID=1737063 RepID=A0A3E1F2B6_9FLAO|nr:hypothetical protein [Brumimicrobium aurantiacum]RFC55956.1 hypothetical protein DXU93_03190 [Brumimicrobium aurantiacum]